MIQPYIDDLSCSWIVPLHWRKAGTFSDYAVMLDGLLLNGGFGERHKRETPVVLLRLTMRRICGSSARPDAARWLAPCLLGGCRLPVALAQVTQAWALQLTACFGGVPVSAKFHKQLTAYNMQGLNS